MHKKIISLFVMMSVVISMICSCSDNQMNSAEKVFKSCMDAVVENDMEKSKQYSFTEGNDIVSGVEKMKESLAEEGIDKDIIDSFFDNYLKQIKYEIKSKEKRGSNHVYIVYNLSVPNYDSVLKTVGAELQKKYEDMARGDVTKDKIMEDLTNLLTENMKNVDTISSELNCVVAKMDDGSWKVDLDKSEDIVFK